MASRLSDETLREIYETGTQGLIWRSDGGHKPMQDLSGEAMTGHDGSLVQTVDFDALIDSEEPAEAVAAIDPLVMYHSLQQRGVEDSLDIIPLLTPEQFIKVIDYEGWDRDRLSLATAMRWLDACRSVSKEELFNKFMSLEEEVQSGLLGPYVDFIEEDQYELLSQNEQDTYQQLPCRTSWWRIKTDDPTVRQLIEDLVEGGLGANIGYTYSLLAHAAHLPPNEQEDQARQFRNARLEEDGFIPFEEAQQIFRHIGNAAVAALAKKYGFADGRSCLESGFAQGSSAVAVPEAGRAFFDEVVAEIRRQCSNHMASAAASEAASTAMPIDPQQFLQTFAHLVNTVCSAVQITPENEAGMKLILVQVRGLIGAALDMLSGSNVGQAVRILAKEHPRELFRFALGVVDILRADAIQLLRGAAIPAADKIERLWLSGRHGALLFAIDTDLLETVGFESSEMLKGLFNRFPMRPVSQRFLPDGDRRIVFRNLSSRTDMALLARDVAQIETNWRKQQ